MISRYEIQEWLSSHAPELACPVCRGRSFNVTEDQLAMTNSIQDKNGRVNYLSGFPLVVLTCQDCAHVLFFSAKQVGLL